MNECDNCRAGHDLRDALGLPEDAGEPDILTRVLGLKMTNEAAMDIGFHTEFEQAVRAEVATDKNRVVWRRLWEWNPAFVRAIFRGQLEDRWIDNGHQEE